MEFEKNNPDLCVCGSRELQFFQGKAQGTILPGFQYKSDKGAHSVSLAINSNETIAPQLNNSTINVYYNGECEFVPMKGSGEKQAYNVIAHYQN